MSYGILVELEITETKCLMLHKRGTTTLRLDLVNSLNCQLFPPEASVKERTENTSGKLAVFDWARTNLSKALATALIQWLGCELANTLSMSIGAFAINSRLEYCFSFAKWAPSGRPEGRRDVKWRANDPWGIMPVRRVEGTAIIAGHIKIGVVIDKSTRPSSRSCRYSSSAESRWTTISIYIVPSDVIIVNKKVPWIEISIDTYETGRHPRAGYDTSP